MCIYMGWSRTWWPVLMTRISTCPTKWSSFFFSEFTSNTSASLRQSLRFFPGKIGVCRGCRVDGTGPNGPFFILHSPCQRF